MPAAAAVTKDLNYYLEHPDEMPHDPDEIMKIATQAEKGMYGNTAEPDIDVWGGGKAEVQPITVDKGTEKTPEPTAEQAKPAEPDPTQQQANSQQQEEKQAEGVQTADGKHVIPYAVLEGTRKRNDQLERIVAEQAAKIDELARAQAAVGDAAGGGNQDQQLEFISPEDLEIVKNELPSLGGILEKQQRAIQMLMEKVSQTPGKESDQDRYAREAREAIDRNTSLVAWEANDVARWNRAVDLADLLVNDPVWGQKSYTELYAKVVDLVKAEMPEQQQQAPATPSAADLAAAAAAKLADIKPPVPLSISQIPGGAPPATSEAEKLGQMSAEQISDYLMRSSGGDPEKMAQALARL